MIETASLKREISPADINVLNEKYKVLDFYERISALYEDFAAEEVMLTSSFTATYAFLLKIFSDVNRDQLV